MDAIDWQAPGTLHARDDGGSDLHYNFSLVREGTLGDLVRHVARLNAAERARMVIEVPGGRTLAIGEILALAAREDLGD